ncbi:hypothetical protein EGW08_019554 [Elysia chlorotica]|uniref:DNA-dependent protein kinase catalytic subunit n=1 Tax=Elysia chlorotica TaxID=188477 RepID=A0A433STT3_ELYCH|nr:hypothetical protein EGW08_019554 [Elysia chlorotica]
MSAGLEETLRSLHESVDDPKPNRELSDVLIEDIKQICSQEITDKDIDLTCALLFHKTTGLVKFLLKSAKVEELQNAKANALNLLSEFIQRAEKKVLPYAVDIKDTCVTVYSLDRFAKVKNAAIPVLIKLLELTAGAAMGNDLDIEKLITKFFMELSKGASKLTASVKASIYTLLGIIAEVFPDLMAPYEDKLMGIYVGALKAEQMTAKTKKAELPVIAGCLEGLTAFLLNFTHSYSYEIFKYTRMAIDPNISYTRYDVPRAGLKLLARHAAQFKTFLMDEYRPMYEKLAAWSRHNNREVLHLGVAALEAFVREVRCLHVCFFLLEFREIMNNKFSTPKQVSMAIRGYGLLAAPCRSFLQEDDVQFMFGEMISQCEHQFFGPSEDMSEKLMSVPSYLTALANIVRQVNSVSIEYPTITFVQLYFLFFFVFYKFDKIFMESVHKCASYFFDLYFALVLFTFYIHTYIFQSLLRTCSHPILTETNKTDGLQDTWGTEAGGAPLVTHKDYLSLWSTLLESAKIKDLAADDFTIGDRTRLTEAVYNQLMVSVLKVLQKLDLEATVTDENDPGVETKEEESALSADPTYGVIAKRPKDFQIFINLVDFCKDLLVTTQWRFFQPWVFTFSHTLISLSTRHPLVSGFYKLLSVTLTVANKLDYFKDNLGGGRETRDTYQLVKKFSKEVLVRIRQYKDDLLASCLTLILSLPKQVIVEQIADIVPSIQTTFIIGLSYLPLATIGLEALEQWSRLLPRSVLAPHYKHILPYLDAYLRTDFRGWLFSFSDNFIVFPQSSSSQLHQVKQRILRYLGGLGGEINQDLLANADLDVSSEAIAWDTYQHLRFDVPFFDMKPVIYFDQFLPQVVKLAQQSSDRQTKVAACELLHGLVLYSLGRGAHMPGQASLGRPMEQLYRRLFPPLLSLACDVEQVCKDLFEPLVLQLIHWFTSNKMAESPETMALLDCIFDGLVQGTDTALRDLSARCLREFLDWSLKQTSKKAAEKNPVNAKSVFKRMKSYALHPSSAKRFGAAMAFNSIYMIFREEEPLVDRFTFEILVYFVESLAIAHKDEESLGTQKQCAKVLEHLERIIRVKADLLKKDPGVKKRPEPSAWNSRKLEIALRWLTRQCGNPQTECRHACMKMVYNLCTLLPGTPIHQHINLNQAFCALIFVDGHYFFMARFEGGGNTSSESHGLLAYPEMHSQGDEFSPGKASQWFDMLLAVLDCYFWVFQEELMTPTQLFCGTRSEMSNIFKSVAYFLNNLALHDITAAASQFQKPSDLVFTPREVEKYNRLKCTVIIRIFNFLSVLLAKHSSEIEKVVPAAVWCENLWKLLCACVVHPTAVGFDMADTKIMQQLPKEVRHLYSCVFCFFPAHSDLAAHLPVDLASPPVGTDWLTLTQMAEGYSQLHAVNLLPDTCLITFTMENIFLVARLLLIFIYIPSLHVFSFLCFPQGIVEKSNGQLLRATLAPTALNLAKSFLSLALNIGLRAETLVERLLDKTPVSEALGSKDETLAQGSLFFSFLGPVVNQHVSSARGRDVVQILLGRVSLDITAVGGILISVLDFLIKDKQLRKREGPQLSQAILDQWGKLGGCWGDAAMPHSQSLALMLLTKLLLIDSKCVSDAGSPSFKPVFEMYLSMLQDSRTSMSFKNQVLDLLPFFASAKDDTELQLKEALNRYIANNFPLKSSEFAAGTHQFTDYISGIDKLLIAMEMSGSLMLLEILISVFCRHGDLQIHQHTPALILLLFLRLPMDKQGPALDVPFAIFTNFGGFPSEIRKAAVERVCLPLLRLVSIANMMEFFVKHIHTLVEPLDVKLIKGSEPELEQQLTTRSCCFQLLELMYARLPKEMVKSLTSPINRSFCRDKVDTGNEMTQKITKAAQEAKSEDSRGELPVKDLRRQYHCHAYNLMVAIISCVQTELKFYKGFLFQDNVTKGQFLLDNIVDKNMQYDFEVELQSPLERRRKFVSIRSEKKAERGGSGDGVLAESGGSGEDNSGVTPSLHLASQFLADSSLSEDVTKYDFSMTAGAGQVRAGQTHLSADVSMQENYVELEMDALNKHECMAPLIALIKHMVDNKISPEVPQGTVAKEMPAWMPYLHEKLSNPSTHINIKLFVAKLIMNCSQTFKPYASFWLRPLCQLLFMSEVSEKGLNYFVVDLIVTMLSWHTVAIPEDSAEHRAMASRLVKFVTGNVYHHNRQIFRSNLDLLRTLLDCWADRVEVPYDIVYDLFHTKDAKSPKLAAGVQVLGVVVTGKFPAYGPSAPVDRDSYLRTFFGLMTNPLKLVYAAAAEVTGLILRRLSESGQGNDEKAMHDHLTALLLNLASANVANFIKCVHSIHKNYPPITDRFLPKLLFVLPSLPGTFRPLCLEVILGHLDKMENAYLELYSKGLADFLTHRDAETQHVALRIVKGMMVRLKSAELLSLLPAVAAFSGHSSAPCRLTMLDILMWAYDNYRDDEDEEGHKIMILTKEALLKGLCDEDLKCKLVCQNFWASNTRLPEGTLERTVSLLEAMYSPGTEPFFLAYATNLLLQATSRSPDYQRPVFEHALTECSFQDYSVHSSWRQRHAAMTPLFAVTQVTQSMRESDSGEDQMDGVVRATQDGGQQFTATLDVAGSGRAFNWLTQSSFDTFAETPGTLGADTQLLFRLGTGGQGPSKQQGKGQLSTNSAGAAQSQSHALLRVSGSALAHNDMWRLKRRFLKDTDSQQVYHAKRNIRLRRLREEALKEQRARRENQVTLYRKYRIGDFPDIQIKHQCLIAPLQALANRDNTIASLLFSCLFRAIFSEMDQVKTERQTEELTDQINQSIEAIFAQSVLYFPPFIGSILTILYELRASLKVSASPLASGATVSNQQILGSIMVLEEQLIQTDSRQASSSAKRPRLAREDVTLHTSLWIELSRLYKSIGEFDVLQGIFSDKLGTKEITRKAIEAEARGDYKAAFKLYEQAMTTQDWSDSDPQEAEVDFWDVSRMECLDYLTQWKELDTIATRGIDDSPSPKLDRVWEDGYYQEHYLPYLMRSKLKLLLSGAEDQGNRGQADFLSFLTEALKDEQKKQHLQSRYCQELALLFLWQGDYDTARHYTSLAFESFLQSWSSTTTLMESNRRENLHGLQGMLEQQEFLDFTASLERAGSLSVSELTKRWQGRSPHSLLDPVTIWDDIVTNRFSERYFLVANLLLNIALSRNMFLSRLAGKMAASGSEEHLDSQDSELLGDEREEKLAQMSVSFFLAMANSCRLQNNFAVTLKMMKNTKDKCQKLGDPALHVDWMHLYAKTHQCKARASLQWTDETLSNVCTTLDQLVKENPALLRSGHLGLSQRVLTGHSLDLLVTGLLARSDIASSTRTKVASYANIGNSAASQDEIVAGLLTKGYETLKASAAAAEWLTQSEQCQDFKVMTPEMVNLELAKYCDKYLHLKEDGEPLYKFPVAVVTCLLRAMEGGIVEARQRFPRLLQLADMYPEVKDVFIRKVCRHAAEIPSWMFLMWVSQMTALLDKPEAQVVAPLLLRIAEDYPQALIYPFRMSSEGYNFGSSAQDSKNKDTVHKLEELCSNPVINKFISALEQFGQPDMIFKDWCSDMRKLLADRKRSKGLVEKKFRELVSQLFDVRSSASQDTLSTQTSFTSTAGSVPMGDYRKGFAEFSSAEAKITSAISSLQGQRGNQLAPPTKIKDYCPWMSDFNPSKSGDLLEIPGQYDGLSKPLPEYHVKIAGFDERVLVMKSLRKPKRIMIRGNDERDFPYLVKSGEDLRMDQRIETLFLIMNGVMEADPGCRQRKLRLKTYQVISMTPRVGLIEWMRHTQPLKEFLMDALSEDEQKYLDPKSPHAPGNQHMKWVEKAADRDNRRGFQGMFDKVFTKYSHTETVREFRQKEGKIPWNLSRQALQRLSSSPEAFYVLRSTLLRSHAVVCVCQYLLGIGDRHLSNFMVNLKTGHMVGIDFGHAFGSATQFLPVPELMPFRLTRQLTNLNMPMQVKGQTESCMRHALRALRADSDLLLSTMDVFVKEPSLDWMVDAAEDEKWYPKQKIQFAQRKLQGDHPCHIMRDELELGHSKREAFRSFVKVLMGDKKENARAELPAHGLTVEQQVTALIDHATDPNILGRTWGGWEPWV